MFTHSFFRFLKKLVFLYCVFSAFFGTSQTTVNAYAKITSITNNSVLALSNVDQTNHTFTVGGQVVVMQMQDNVIGTNTTNASSFGNLSSIANAGSYEIRTISARTPTSGSPTSVTLSAALTNTYNTGANSSVQMISFRDLGSNYTTTANISGNTWNGNVGGVIAFFVTNTLTLNHSVLADGLGFRGGAVSSNAAGDLTCVNTSYISTLTTLGKKGEGIYAATTTSFTQARGKILNGGGGGSENNAGGGGGGNYSAGGDGGLGYPCTTANSGRGLGGIALSGQISASRIFMGGGGGGGQANNSVATPGGNGGGIILIKANTIVTGTTCVSSITVSANGNTAADSGNDGAGGGGAGGSIVIQANAYSVNSACPITFRSNGGGGGSVGNSASHGGGGGGGQGVVIYSSAQPTTNVTTQTNNGAAGADNNSGNINAGSGGGSNGGGISSLPPSGTPLPIKLVKFRGELEKDKIKLSWTTASEKNSNYFLIEKSLDGINFSEIGKVFGNGNNNQTNEYSIYDYLPGSGLNYYRLKQTDYSGFEYSSLIYINYNTPFDFSVFPNPTDKESSFIVKCDLSGWENADVYLFELTGKELAHYRYKQSDKIEMSIKNMNLEKGIYLLKLQIGDNNKIKKLSVQ